MDPPTQDRFERTAEPDNARALGLTVATVYTIT